MASRLPACFFMTAHSKPRNQRNRSPANVLSLALCFIAITWNPALHSETLYFIDAHSQVDQDIKLDTVVEKMRHAGIQKTILAARGKRKPGEIASLAEKYPDLIIAAVRTKGRHYKNNTDRYYKKLANQVESGRYDAMAELILFHAQKGERAGQVTVYPDDRRVQTALVYAKRNNWPLVLHIEFASLNEHMRRKYFSALKTLLDAHKNHSFVLIHMGQLPADQVENLISENSNIYFMTSHSNTISVQRSNQPWVNMFAAGELAPHWKKLIIKHPRKFIFAIDNVWPEHWLNGYSEQVELWRNALNQLPSEAAHAVAHGNAEALWGIK